MRSSHLAGGAIVALAVIWNMGAAVNPAGAEGPSKADLDKARQALAKYEDVIFDADGNEVVSLDRLHELAEAEREGRIRIGSDWTPCAEGMPANSGMYEVTWESKRDGKLFCGHATFYAIKKKWDEEYEGYSVVAWASKRREPYRADDTTGKVKVDAPYAQD